MQQLRGVVPLVQRLTLLQAVITLQAQHGALQGQAQGLGKLGLADTGFTFQQQRAFQFERQKYGRCEAAVSEIAHSLQRLHHGIDIGKRLGF